MRLLSDREIEVLKLFHYERKDIAEKLFITERTVMSHIHTIFQILGARTRTEAVLIALRMGIVKLEDYEVEI